uniref:Signal transduction protein syg1 n=1 Tax=Colletotrichum fructicola (strain Nara gc5) TaxID=1213859 RepID=L2FR60_COLFN
MKFAKELEQDLVPEWRVKYLDYKAGKKLVKKVSRAINRANGSPQGNSGKLNNRGTSNFFNSDNARETNPDERTSLREGSAPVGSARQKPMTPARAIPANHEHQTLTSGSNDMQYGSFVHAAPARGSSPRSAADLRAS